MKVYIVIEAEGYYGDYATVIHQFRSYKAAKRYATAGWRVLPIDADYANLYQAGRRIHRIDVTRIAAQCNLEAELSDD